MKSIQLTYSIILTVLLAQACRSPNKIMDKPESAIKNTEFHREPATLIPEVYANLNSRGVDRRSDAGYTDSIGFGAGLLVNSAISPQWNGHKFFYYYVDLDVSSERQGPSYPGDTNWVLSTYPGMYVRTYTPFWMKLHYGAGLNLRLTETRYDKWGVYGRMGLELYGFHASVIFIGHPGQSNWETEYRGGWMYAPINK